jgi:hypothetical protein
MLHIPKIQKTLDYKVFSFIPGNRPINFNLIQELKKDPSFPDKFPTSPIIVKPSVNYSSLKEKV